MEDFIIREEILDQVRSGISCDSVGRKMCHRCKWCYNIIWHEFKDGDKTFCCNECFEEDKDFKYTLHYKNNLEGQRRRNEIKRLQYNY